LKSSSNTASSAKPEGTTI